VRVDFNAQKLQNPNREIVALHLEESLRKVDLLRELFPLRSRGCQDGFQPDGCRIELQRTNEFQSASPSSLFGILYRRALLAQSEDRGAR